MSRSRPHLGHFETGVEMANLSASQISGMVENVDIAEYPASPAIFRTWIKIIRFLVTAVLWLPVAAACTPMYSLGTIVWGRPPIIPTCSRFCRYLMAPWTEGKPDDDVLFTNRVLAFLLVLLTLIKSPFYGICWFIDELLFSSYHKVAIDKPVFIISAARSGSTQLVHYLEEDTHNFISPMVIEQLFPFIWTWKLAAVVTMVTPINKNWLEDPVSYLGKEAKKRHNFHLLKSDTWEIPFGSIWQLSFFTCWALGRRFMKWGHPECLLDEPVDVGFYRSLIPYTDCVMKKVMYHRGNPKQRMLIKGHCLLAANTLEHHYHDAKFLTVVRDPLSVTQSFMNFLKVMATEGPHATMGGMFPIPWKVARDVAIDLRAGYCKQEMIFFDQSHTDNKLAVLFTDYTKDLTGTLQRIYLFCDVTIPDTVLNNANTAQSTSHNRTRRRADYDPQFNRSLASVGINEQKLKEHLVEYCEWLKRLQK